MSGQAAHDSPVGGVEGAETNDMPPFRAQIVEDRGGIPVLDLQGEIDIHTSPDFKRALLPLIEGGRRHIVVDAAQVTFMDSTALGVFLSGEKRMRPLGGSIIIICRNSIARLFEITGLDRVFTICRTRDEALQVATTRQEDLGTPAADERGVTRP